MHIFINYYYFSTGAEWWAQQFGKSLPFLNWLPFLSGKTIHLLELNLKMIISLIVV
jgi:ethanolaminephosphotransferase